MSAETFPLCCSTQNWGIRNEGQIPRQLRTQPSQLGMGRVSVGWAMEEEEGGRGLAVGVVGGHIEVEVGEEGGGMGREG